eukprot:g19006.t1
MESGEDKEEGKEKEAVSPSRPNFPRPCARLPPLENSQAAGGGGQADPRTAKRQSRVEEDQGGSQEGRGRRCQEGRAVSCTLASATTRINKGKRDKRASPAPTSWRPAEQHLAERRGVMYVVVNGQAERHGQSPVGLVQGRAFRFAA